MVAVIFMLNPLRSSFRLLRGFIYSGNNGEVRFYATKLSCPYIKTAQLYLGHAAATTTVKLQYGHTRKKSSNKAIYLTKTALGCYNSLTQFCVLPIKYNSLIFYRLAYFC